LNAEKAARVVVTVKERKGQGDFVKKSLKQTAWHLKKG